MKAPFWAVLLALTAVLAWAGPNPYAHVTVTANATVALLALTENALILQCPGGIVRYRTFNSAEWALQDAGPQADGGAFGLLVDFTESSGPQLIIRTPGQVGIGILGTDAGGTLTCDFLVP